MMIRISIYLALTITITSAEDQSSSRLSDHLIGFSSFIGKTYEGNFINSTKENPMVDVLSFERALNGSAIKIIHSVNDGEFGGETIIMWDSKVKSLRSWYFTSAGSLTLQDVEMKGEKFISIEDVSQNQNGITKVKTIIELMHGNKLQKRTKYLMDNLWMDGNDMIYKHVIAKRPNFN